MNGNRNRYNPYHESREQNPQNRRNQPRWRQDRHFDNRHFEENYDYGSYTSDTRREPMQNRNQGYGSYEGAPTGYQEHHPNNPYPYEDMHGHNDYGYAGGNPGFQSAAEEYRGDNWPEANYNFGVGTGRTDDYYAPRNERRPSRGNEFERRRNTYENNRQVRKNVHPMGQTMDSWDNDYNHWHSEKYGKGGFDVEENQQDEQYNYRPQNQGYFGENMGRHSGGNLYNPRFRNDDNFSRFNREEERWHADSLSDRNIEGWGR